MKASQVDETITNEDSIVVPFTSGRIVATIGEGVQIGVLSINNDMGSNKSIILPIYREPELSTLTVVAKGDSPDFEVPEWYSDAANDLSPDNPKSIRKAMAVICDRMAEEDLLTSIDREYQVNILVPADGDSPFYKESHHSKALNYLRFEVLASATGADKADYRDIHSVDKFRQNGHVLEATLRSTLMKAWTCDEIDLPYSLCRDLRWLGAQYLTKNTRGNLFPQLMPSVEEQIALIEAKQMKGHNAEWGALAAFSKAIRR